MTNRPSLWLLRLEPCVRLDTCTLEARVEDRPVPALSGQLVHTQIIKAIPTTIS